MEITNVQTLRTNLQDILESTPLYANYTIEGGDEEMFGPITTLNRADNGLVLLAEEGSDNEPVTVEDLLKVLKSLEPEDKVVLGMNDLLGIPKFYMDDEMVKDEHIPNVLLFGGMDSEGNALDRSDL